MTRHELPGDQWAEFRDPVEVPEKYRRPITKLSAGLSKTARVLADTAAGENPDVDDVDLDLMFALNDALVVALTSSWSFSQPITADGLGELPGPAYDVLLKLAAPHVAELLPDFGQSPVVDSPTVPSPVSV